MVFDILVRMLQIEATGLLPLVRFLCMLLQILTGPKGISVSGFESLVSNAEFQLRPFPEAFGIVKNLSKRLFEPLTNGFLIFQDSELETQDNKSPALYQFRSPISYSIYEKGALAELRARN